MNLNNEGKEFIKSFEGLRLKAYKVVDTEMYFTIGYGHYGSDIKEGMTITMEQANQLFNEDIKKYEKAVNECNLAFTPNQNQFNALVSFCYNLGVNIMNDFTMMSAEQVSNEMLLYIKSGGQVLEGLKTRRKKEVELFNKTIEKEYIIKEYEEYGTFYPNTEIYYRNAPFIKEDNPIKGSYLVGENVYYDKVVITNNYVYISWISAISGDRRYMPIRENNNNTYGAIWGYIK